MLTTISSQLHKVRAKYLGSYEENRLPSVKKKCLYSRKLENITQIKESLL
jgi:hypothetical protein